MRNQDIDTLFRAIDPLAFEDPTAVENREEAIWESIVASLEERKPNRSRRLWSVGAVGTSATVIAVLVATLSNAPTSSAAAVLKAAAEAQSHSVGLPRLAQGQFHFQQSQVSLVCEISSPGMQADEAPLTYVSDGTMQSWTNSDGSGKVLVTPSTVDAGGSHFASASDEARWIALGKPFIPCAIANSSNALGGNPANANSVGSQGGYTATVGGFSGFGLSLAASSTTDLLSSATSINNLPTDTSQISSLLANGQINADGSVNPSPGVCAILDGSNLSSTGCTPSEQLDVIEQLIQLPDASAKLGANLYEVLAGMPGARLIGTEAAPDGSIGTAVEVPQGSNERFEVILNPATGELLSCSELITQDGVTTAEGSVSYGQVQTVQGEGVVPTPTSP